MESQLAIDAGKTDENLSYSDLKSDIPIALHSHLESRESFEAKELEKWKAIEKIADLDVHTHNKAQKFPTVTNKEGSIIAVKTRDFCPLSFSTSPKPIYEKLEP